MATLTPTTRKNVIYGLIGFTVVAIVLGIFISRGNIPQARPDFAAPRIAASPLSSPEPTFHFGIISMAAGNVSHRYKIRNSGATPVTVTQIYTSCMCTTATLVTRTGGKGPFGMPGHGPVMSIAERIAPGEDALVEVVFDPRAHGPSGIGMNQRIVTIRNDAGQPLELRFTAMVTP